MESGRRRGHLSHRSRPLNRSTARKNVIRLIHFVRVLGLGSLVLGSEPQTPDARPQTLSLDRIEHGQVGEGDGGVGVADGFQAQITDGAHGEIGREEHGAGAGGAPPQRVAGCVCFPVRPTHAGAEEDGVRGAGRPLEVEGKKQTNLALARQGHDIAGGIGVRRGGGDIVGAAAEQCFGAVGAITLRARGGDRGQRDQCDKGTEETFHLDFLVLGSGVGSGVGSAARSNTSRRPPGLSVSKYSARSTPGGKPSVFLDFLVLGSGVGSGVGSAARSNTSRRPPGLSVSKYSARSTPGGKPSVLSASNARRSSLGERSTSEARRRLPPASW